MSLNKVMLIGNVGKDPDIRYLEGNNPNTPQTKVATFTLATTERYRDRAGEVRENTEWHNIVAWRSQADIVDKYVRKGTSLFIEGKIRTRSWTDQSEQKHYVTEIVADSLQLLGKKSDNPATQQSPYTAAATAAPASPAAPAVVATPAPVQEAPVQAQEDDSDLPF